MPEGNRGGVEKYLAAATLLILLTCIPTENFTELFAPLAVEPLSFPPVELEWLFLVRTVVLW